MNEKRSKGLSISDLDYLLNGSINQDRKQKDLANIEKLLRSANISGQKPNKKRISNKVCKPNIDHPRLLMTIRRRSNGIYEIVNSFKSTEYNKRRISNVRNKKVLGTVEKLNDFEASDIHFKSENIKNTKGLVRAKAAQLDIRNYYMSNDIDINEYIPHSMKFNKIHEINGNPEKFNVEALSEKKNYNVKVKTLVNNTRRSAARKFSRTPVSKSCDYSRSKSLSMMKKPLKFESTEFSKLENEEFHSSFDSLHLNNDCLTTSTQNSLLNSLFLKQK